MSNAAAALNTSQPSVSRHIQELEEELKITIFIRGEKRLYGLTSPGADAVRIARRIVQDAANLRQIGEQFRANNSGRLLLTTTHTHAQYVLPRVVREFTKRYPAVRMSIKQGHPGQIMAWVAAGEADLSISSVPMHPIPELVILPCYENPIVVLASTGHPLLRQRKLTIADLATQPLITYNSEFSIHAKLVSAFARENLTPNIVLSATDVDVMKTYVREGLGIAIVTSLGYRPKQDKGIRMLDARHLFGSTRISVGLRRYNYLRGYVHHFISMFYPALTRDVVEQAIHSEPPE
jgi:LysR family cys regulon transcriptional activator